VREANEVLKASPSSRAYSCRGGALFGQRRFADAADSYCKVVLLPYGDLLSSLVDLSAFVCVVFVVVPSVLGVVTR